MGTEFCILGPIVVRAAGVVRPVQRGKQRVLLAALLLNANRVVSLDEIAEVFWGFAPPPSARVTTQNYVVRLRKALADTGGSRISTQVHGYLIHVGADELDVARFEALLGAARAAVRDSSWKRASAEASSGLSLWRGEPLADVDSETLAARDVPRLAELRLQALEIRIEADLHLGRHAEVIAELQRLIRDHPMRERLHGLLMLALYRDGRQAEALAAYQHVRRLLIHELGTEPGIVLQELHQQILAVDPASISRPGPELSQARVSTVHQGAATVSSSPARRPARVVPRQLPTPVRHFVGRVDELATLDILRDSVPASAGPVLAAITGTAGVGKSALALQWAHRATARFPDGQLYINLRGYDPAGPPLDPLSAVRGFLESLGTPADAMPREPHAQAALYRSLLSGRRILVVLDNVRDAEQARALLPGTAGAMALITSRDDLTGLAASEGAVRMPLPLLGAAESRRLLAEHVGADRIARNTETADELVDLCAFLPLALSIIGARAAGQPHLPLGTLVNQLRDARGRLDALCAGESSGDLRAIMSCSYQHLSESAARMFRLLGLHPGPDISAAAAASLAAVPAADAARLLNELTRTHLITEHAPGRYTFHDLLRAYAAEQAHRYDSGNNRHAALDRMLDYYLHTAHAAALLQEPPRDRLSLDAAAAGVVPEAAVDDVAAAAWFAGEHAVLLGCVALAAQTGRVTQAWQLAWTLMTAFSRPGRCDDLETALHWVLDAGSRADDLTAQAYAHRFLGRVRGLLGFHDEAYDHLQQALDLFERLGDLAGQAAAHIGLAREHELRAQPVPAIEHATRALELQRAVGYRIGEANGLNNLAWCYVRLGDYARALDYCRQALALQQAIGYRPGEACTWDTLGYVHHHLNQYGAAASCYDRALHLQRQLDDKYEQAGTLGRLGDTHAAAGNMVSARGSWHQALAILEELHHPDAQQLRIRLNDRRSMKRPTQG
jgi:DNA-binding SARP family transcriptional activator/tetratricopeptide (TPR) repeat protein